MQTPELKWNYGWEYKCKEKKNLKKKSNEIQSDGYQSNYDSSVLVL